MHERQNQHHTRAWDTWTCHRLDDVSRIEWQCTDPVSGDIRYCNSDGLRAPKDIDHDRWEYVPSPSETPYYY